MQVVLACAMYLPVSVRGIAHSPQKVLRGVFEGPFYRQWNWQVIRLFRNRR